MSSDFYIDFKIVEGSEDFVLPENVSLFIDTDKFYNEANHLKTYKILNFTEEFALPYGVDELRKFNGHYLTNELKLKLIQVMVDTLQQAVCFDTQHKFNKVLCVLSNFIEELNKYNHVFINFRVD